MPESVHETNVMDCYSSSDERKEYKENLLKEYRASTRLISLDKIRELQKRVYQLKH